MADFLHAREIRHLNNGCPGLGTLLFGLTLKVVSLSQFTSADF